MARFLGIVALLLASLYVSIADDVVLDKSANSAGDVANPDDFAKQRHAEMAAIDGAFQRPDEVAPVPAPANAQEGAADAAAPADGSAGAPTEPAAAASDNDAEKQQAAFAALAQISGAAAPEAAAAAAPEAAAAAAPEPQQNQEPPAVGESAAAPEVPVADVAAPPAAAAAVAEPATGSADGAAVQPPPPIAIPDPVPAPETPPQEVGAATSDDAADTAAGSGAAAATGTARPNRRVASKHSRDQKASAGDPTDSFADDYYGLLQNPADHLDRAAFQPSHILAFEIGPGSFTELFEDVSSEDVGKAVRGDWFVTSGDTLSLQVTVHDPIGDRIYSEGPSSQVADDSGYTQTVPTSEGSFRFRTSRAGTYRISLFNPSAYSARTVSFAWLFGKDDDDVYTSKYYQGGKGNKNAQGADGSSSSGGSGSGDVSTDLSSAFAGSLSSPSEYVVAMLKRVSRLHKRIDDVTAVQQFADVRFARHLRTVESTHRRVAYWTAIETAVILISAVLQVLLVRRFDFKGFKSNPYV